MVLSLSLSCNDYALWSVALYDRERPREGQNWATREQCIEADEAGCSTDKINATISTTEPFVSIAQNFISYSLSTYVAFFLMLVYFRQHLHSSRPNIQRYERCICCWTKLVSLRQSKEGKIN